jgi:hypothetical protein
MRNTYIKLYRKTLNSEVMKDPALLAVWVYLLLNAQWKAKTVKFHGRWMKTQPGQLITGTQKIAEATGLTRDIVRRCLKDLAPTGKGAITRQSTRQGSIITICNWELYQNGNGKSPNESPNEAPSDAPWTPHGRPTIQEGKKEKKGKEDPPSIPPKGDVLSGKNKAKEGKKRFKPPTTAEVQKYAKEKGYTKDDIDPEQFVDFYESKNWYVGKNKMKNWKAAARNWVRRSRERNQQQHAYEQRESMDYPEEEVIDLG